MLCRLVLFLLGLAVGSFLNVVIERLPKGQEIIRGRSCCPQCGHTLVWYDLIPLLSFVLLRGRCRYCGKKISFQYPLVELATGVLFALFLFTNSYLLFTIFLIPIFVIDLKHGIIPDRLIYPAILIALSAQLLAPSLRIFSLYQNLRSDSGGLGPYLLRTDFFKNHTWLEIRPFLFTLAGSLVLYLLFSILHHLFSGRALGGGDVKLAFLVGLITGFPKMIVAVFSAFLIGAVASVILIVLKKKRFGDTVPFGPFLVIGTFIALLFGGSILEWYLGLFG